MTKIKALSAELLYRACDVSQFSFQTTAEIEPLDRPLGQQRALEAIEFAVDIEQDGFNLFVLGASGLGKHELVRQILAQRADTEYSCLDWCYVNNFENPQQPKVLKLPVGMGHKLRKDMESLVEDLLTSLPSTFQSDEYHNRRQEIEDELHDRQEQLFKNLDRDAKEKGITIKRTSGGYALGPVVNGHMLEPEEFKKLPKEERERLQKLIDDVQLELQNIFRDMPLLQREHHQRLKALNQEITQHTVEKLIAWIENAYREQPDVMAYLNDVKKNAIEFAGIFLPENGVAEAGDLTRRIKEFHEYAINVVVDNTQTLGAPVIFEDNPTYQNLLGRVEYISHMGTLITDFTQIKSGALHRANGGYLILDANKVLSHAFAWEGLKRAIKAREIKIQSLEQMLSLASSVSLEPESISIDVKVILIGEPILYYLLKEYDYEFNQLFKVAADFSQETDRSLENDNLYARLIAAIQNREGARPLNKDGVGRVIEYASRTVEDSEKLSLKLESMRDLLTEADYWAGKADSDVIRLEDINLAIEKRRYRQDKYRELMLEQIVRGIKLIDTEDSRVAQINALSVLQVGDYIFGQASRITATARLGRSGIIDIEREVKLGGHLHSKGVMILSSYLANHYAASRPLPLAASLVFEQSYGRVDGDSASAAELCVLLSAVGNIPLKQSLAVTGSINQLGEIQAIGGVNEKIEGFFDICKARGLTGEQGVIIPASNQVHLMLREDIREAVINGKFSVYSVGHVEHLMEILCGMPAGKLTTKGEYPKKSFNHRIQQRIEELQQLQNKFAHEAKKVTNRKKKSKK